MGGLRMDLDVLGDFTHGRNQKISRPSIVNYRYDLIRIGSIKKTMNCVWLTILQVLSVSPKRQYAPHARSMIQAVPFVPARS